MDLFKREILGYESFFHSIKLDILFLLQPYFSSSNPEWQELNEFWNSIP